MNVGPSMWHRAKVETWNISLETAGILAKAGCKVSIITDHPFPNQFLSTAAAMCWANGMSEEDALRRVTLTPAETLGVQNRVGSLDAGKDADFVIWSGHPFPNQVQGSRGIHRRRKCSRRKKSKGRSSRVGYIDAVSQERPVSMMHSRRSSYSSLREPVQHSFRHIRPWGNRLAP